VTPTTSTQIGAALGNDTARKLKIALLVLGVAHLVYFCLTKSGETFGITGLLYPNGMPVGGDFINLWTTAKLILAERSAEIYDVEQFAAYQRAFVNGEDIDLRLWAYPPPSLLFVWPFGLVGFYAALAIWSVVGLAVLAAGARRFGFDRLETAIILLSPATVLNLYYGQTGSLAAGLLLLALSARTSRDPTSLAAAALLTIKPQAGFLLPVLWLFQRQWQMIVGTTVLTLALAGLSVAVFGLGPWRDYLDDTLPVLSKLEREGGGAFMTMIPSMFMALRIVIGESSVAIIGHLAFAAVVLVILLVRLKQVSDPTRRAAILLIATVLMTPYLHNYDLALLLCGSLLAIRRLAAMEKPPAFAELLVITAWALPQVVVLLNMVGIPISPLLILPLLFLV
jgi:alpha-1,2-mannosyltransferase